MENTFSCLPPPRSGSDLGQTLECLPRQEPPPGGGGTLIWPGGGVHVLQMGPGCWSPQPLTFEQSLLTIHGKGQAATLSGLLGTQNRETAGGYVMVLDESTAHRLPLGR